MYLLNESSSIQTNYWIEDAIKRKHKCKQMFFISTLCTNCPQCLLRKKTRIALKLTEINQSSNFYSYQQNLYLVTFPCFSYIIMYKIWGQFSTDPNRTKNMHICKHFYSTNSDGNSCINSKGGLKTPIRCFVLIKTDKPDLLEQKIISNATHQPQMCIDF